MENQTDRGYSRQNITRNALKRIFIVAVFLAFGGILLFISAGKIDWAYAWIYVIITAVIPLAGVKILPPDLIAERGRKKENIEQWDKIITRLIIFPWFAQYIVAGLDIRFGWTPEYTMSVHLAAAAAYLAGQTCVIWSMSANRFFSSSVRIQYDRGHTVITHGPYRFLRHPGYLGMIIYFVSTPLLLGSYWAFIPICVIVVLLIIRTAKEDKTLQNKLQDYKKYTGKVKYKLFPGIW